MALKNLEENVCNSKLVMRGPINKINLNSISRDQKYVCLLLFFGPKRRAIPFLTYAQLFFRRSTQLATCLVRNDKNYIETGKVS